jgi:hypothetical protein
VEAGLPQLPGNIGPDRLGFAKEGFRALLALRVTAQDLGIGASFSGDRATALARALGEARASITNMPVRHTRLPNSGNQLFDVTGRAAPLQGNLTLTDEMLQSWGQLTLPGPLWRTMQRLGAWIEPVLVAEWARLVRGYALRMGMDLTPQAAELLLTWQDPARDTNLARLAAERIDAAGTPITCVWSGARLRPAAIDIDHALPWSVWPCGHLWNLMPSSRRVNQHEKRDRLPSAAALARAREGVVEWWRNAWGGDAALYTRFTARAALPLDNDHSLEAIFAGMEWKRLRVQQDQQPPEWDGMNLSC